MRIKLGNFLKQNKYYNVNTKFKLLKSVKLSKNLNFSDLKIA